MSTSKTVRGRVLLAVAVVCTIGLCVVAVAIMLRDNPHAGISGDAYFFDLNNNTLFVAPASSIPPIDAPSGRGPGGKPMGVRAYLYRCDDNHINLSGMTAEQVEQAGAYIGYLEKRTDAFKAYVEKSESGTPPDPSMAARMVKQPNLISKLDGQRWVPDVSPEGLKILQRGRNGCSGSDAIPCTPQ